MHARSLLASTALLLSASFAWCQEAVPKDVPAEAAPSSTGAPDAASAPVPSAPPAPAPETANEPAAQLPDVEVTQEPEQEPSSEPKTKAVDGGDAAPPATLKPVKTKPVKRKPKSVQVEAVAPQAKTAAAAQPAPEFQPIEAPVSEPSTALLPGTLVITEKDMSSVTTATAGEIVATQGPTITDTLAKKPGVASSSFAPGASRPILRGLDNNRIRIQEGGIGTHDVSHLSEDHAVPVDPFAAESIEVIHGPSTLRYGGQAIGGVVSVENGRVPSAMPSNGFSGAVTGGWSSADDGRDGAFKANAGSGGVAVHADGFKRKAEDYDTPRGIQENTFVDSQGGAAGASVIGPDGFAGIAFTRIESAYGIPAEDVFIDMQQDKIMSRGEWRVRTGGVEVLRYWFGASDYAHDEVAPGNVTGSRFTNRSQEFRAEAEQQSVVTTMGRLEGSWGINLGHERLVGQSFEGSSLLDPAETDRVGGFVFQTLGLTDELKVLAAGRVEHVSVDGSGLLDFSNPLALVAFTGEKTFKAVSVSAGLSYDFANSIIGRLTGQYVERAPEAAELYSKGLHEATGTFEIGNPNLKEEKASTIEIGLAKSQGPLRFDASAYYTHFDGFIARGLTGVGCGDTIDTCGVEDELDQVLFQQRDANFYGAEAIAQLDIAPIWNGVWGIEGQYDFVNAKFTDGENVPRIPPHRLGGGLYYRDGAWLARAGVLHAFEQNRIASQETPTEGYTLVSAEISYTARMGSPGADTEMTIGIRGENLADEEVRNHASFKKDEVLQPGASVRIFGSIKLN